jgi:hypothetical protein
VADPADLDVLGARAGGDEGIHELLAVHVADQAVFGAADWNCGTAELSPRTFRTSLRELSSLR